MKLGQLLIAAVLLAAIGLGAPDPALAHGADAPGAGVPYGWHSGPMMGPGYGQGMMGPGYGHGMMGPGYGHGMMGPGYGPGMMGRGYGHGMMGPGYGPGMMGRGYEPGYGPGMMRPLREDLSVADVRHILEHRLAWQGNPNLKLGKVEEKDEDTIVAEIVTQDGSLVERLDVDRHTGWMQPVR